MYSLVTYQSTSTTFQATSLCLLRSLSSGLLFVLEGDKPAILQKCHLAQALSGVRRACPTVRANERPSDGTRPGTERTALGGGSPGMCEEREDESVSAEAFSTFSQPHPGSVLRISGKPRAGDKYKGSFHFNRSVFRKEILDVPSTFSLRGNEVFHLPPFQTGPCTFRAQACLALCVSLMAGLFQNPPGRPGPRDLAPLLAVSEGDSGKVLLSDVGKLI
uniref:Uncharacterized protein n=1 Tax=Pipistrellus kuhlii TaxID=59472 RepID=A0A7J7YNA1_PIPKU|nr:hypothetical protein mPipKuh1_010143 [Pipistrellus kuhlii]